MRAFMLLSLSMLPVIAHAQPGEDVTGRQAEGKGLAQETVGKAIDTAKDKNAVYQIPFYEDRDWGTYEDAEGIAASGEGAIATNPTAGWLVESQQTRPSAPVSRDDPFMQRAFDLYRQDHSDLIGGLTEEYGDCRVEGGPREVETSDMFQCDRRREPSEKTCEYDRDIQVDEDYRYICDEVLDKTTNTCTVGRIVKVDKDYLYQCTNNQVIERRSCSETLTVTVDGTLTCTGYSDVINVGGFNNFRVSCSGSQRTVTVSGIMHGGTWTFPIQDAEQTSSLYGEVWINNHTETSTRQFQLRSWCQNINGKKYCYIEAKSIYDLIARVNFNPKPGYTESWSSTCGDLESIAR